MDIDYNNEDSSPQERGPGPGKARFWVVWGIVFAAVLLALVALLPAFLREAGFGASKSVVLYCAQDQTYAEPILRYFQRSRGVRVKTVFDSEAVKTVGLANRLLAEKDNPRCDLFWGNEELRTRQLARRGVFQETNGWIAFGYRSRRIVVGTNQLPVLEGPRSLLELTNPVWQGKVALSYPQFGTTATHFHALRQLWGDALWESWCRGLAANKPFLVDGNSVVVDLVGKGVALIGLTDSDDIVAGQAKGYPVDGMPLNGESLLIPNTLGIVRNARNAGRAQLLYEHLQSPMVIEALVRRGALEGPSAAELQKGTLKVDWERLLENVDQTTARLNTIFLR